MSQDLSTAQLYVKSHHAIPVYLDVLFGTFVAHIDDDKIEHETLAGLIAHLDRLQARLAASRRNALPPVEVVLLVPGRYATDTFTIERCAVVGLVAGRTYTPAVRVRQGTERRTINAKTLHCIPQDDPAFLEGVRTLLLKVQEAATTLRTRQHEIQSLYKSLPMVQVPFTATKDEALAQEPAFLEALRTIGSPEEA